MRMGIAMMFAIAPLHFANRKIQTKVIMGIIVIIMSIAVFFSSGFQKKTFFSGSGEITDVIGYEANDNFDTSGRNTIHSYIINGIKDKPFFGHGPRADLQLLEKSGFLIKEVHNDYLSVQYNYGKVGLGILLFCFMLQFLHLFRRRNLNKTIIFRIAIFSSLTLFIPMLGFMYSDNVMKYAIYFGNYHFALMGISYALLQRKNNADISTHPAVQQAE